MKALSLMLLSTLLLCSCKDTFKDADSDDIVPNLEPKIEWVEDEYYKEESQTHTTCDSNGQNCNTYTETWKTNEWVDTSHNETFYYGNGFRFDNTSTVSRDLKTMAALNETMAGADR